MIRKGSRSFASAARLFDAQNRRRARMLYAWCRHCDDVVDGQDLCFARRDYPDEPAHVRLEKIRAQTRAALSGHPDEHPVFVGLSRVVSQCEIPHRFPMDLLDGFSMDVQGREYQTLTDTLSYSYHVAGTVGIMMAYIMGVRSPPTLQRAADLGIAFQLTNIARDIRDDEALGRVYVPSEWLPQVGASCESVLAAEHRSELVAAVHRLLDEADRYYESAVQGIPALDFRSAWAVAAARNVYRDIGNVVRERGAGAWDTRAVVSKGRKLRGIGLALIQALAARGHRKLGDAQGRDESLWRVPGLET